MVNNSFRKYGYDEKVEFVGLQPKLMNKLGDDYTIGKVDEPVVSIFNPTAKGNDSLMVVDTEALAADEE